MPTIFIHGSLRVKHLLVKLLCEQKKPHDDASLKSDSLTLKKAELKGYKQSGIIGRPYPAIVYTGNDQDIVIGEFCTGLTDEDVKIMDGFEDEEYERTKVHVRVLEDNSIHNTETYAWTAGTRKLTGEKWDVDEFVKSGKAKKVEDQIHEQRK